MKRSFSVGMFLGASITAIAFVVSSEVTSSLDPVKISPQYYKILLENEQVRVLEYRLKPGEKEKEHSHPAGIIYTFGEGRIRSTLADGTNSETTAKPGKADWRNPLTHSIENIGTTELHSLAIEMKKSCN